MWLLSMSFASPTRARRGFYYIMVLCTTGTGRLGDKTKRDTNIKEIERKREIDQRFETKTKKRTRAPSEVTR